ncbi:type II toxin-antitoxin system HicB family antitoxin [Saccharibacillus endophyticus]|uniref:Type II toxin-antitoxin system HicB family antitoxin n=1 Tax=Saccharibacillus endophyticus TaxID=2060666 RepID=A0ABQ1ZY51_9BACL|nr:type II toxin-antitoxin system HicB family antitoxin [Saccharibacillus endophyticus]GGH79661.1 hypothetical protein GCM10007362_26790 [Saccharibacillus endophyticus]
MAFPNYKIEIQALTLEDGGGFLATVPSLPGCMSDGETPVEALENVQDAIKAWIETAQELGRSIPEFDGEYKPFNEYSGKLSLRIPKYIHKKLAEKSQEEDVSINQLIQSYISFGMGYDQGLKSIFEHHIQNQKDVAFQAISKQWDAFDRNKFKRNSLVSTLSMHDSEIF